MPRVILGSETDDALFARLAQVVAELGGTMTDREWVLGGSQEITRYTIALPSGSVEATAETYVGLSLSGNEALVREIESRIRA